MTCSRSSSPTGASFSRGSNCSKRSGEPRRMPERTASTSMLPNCAKKSNQIPSGRVSSSPSPESATASPTRLNPVRRVPGENMPAIFHTGQVIDHYKIIRLLGQGGASHVYLAQDLQALQEVILKFPVDDVIGGAAVFARYKREAEIGKRLNHPFIQRHVNQGEERSADYLVLEYLRGQTLRAVMEEHAPALLPTAEVIRLLLQVCEALAFAHEKGVIHRDIKPENILLLDTGEIKLLDFGIALFLEEKRRMVWRGLSSPVGTPDYMAPERLQGAEGDARADIYAVGVVLYELL